MGARLRIGELLVAGPLLLAGTTGVAWSSEPEHGCFRSPAEAALVQASGVLRVDPPIANGAMDGARDVGGDFGGYRVESVRGDALLGRSWAVVRSCEHPERPAVVVEMLRLAGDEARVAVPAVTEGERGRSRAREVLSGSRVVTALVRTSAPVLIAGARVEVVRVEENVRLRMLAVAERSAAVGERVRLRVVREAGESEEIVEGVVRGAGLVEMEAAR